MVSAHRGEETIKGHHFIVGLVLVAALVTGACGSSTAASPDIDDARAELLGYVGDIPGADGYRYNATDDRGHVMDTVKVIQIDPDEFAAVYHWWSDDSGFVVSLATSTNLLDWTWRVDLAAYASQPYIAEASDGGWVVAWEQEPPSQDENYLRMALYPDWDALVTAAPTKVFSAERLLSDCAEGTPNIYSASSTQVAFGFTFFADCVTDREGLGTTDWTTWDADTQPHLDRAALFQGYRGNIGDREVLEFRGYAFTFLESQFTQDDWRTFRVLLYDEGVGTRDPVGLAGGVGAAPSEPPSTHVFMWTHAGSFSFTNLTATAVVLDGQPALVFGVFIPEEGAQADEAGQLIYYRFIEER
jgi:hypothetical protein